jgi:hypothetical protein
MLFGRPRAWVLGEFETLDKSMVTGAEAFWTEGKRSIFVTYGWSIYSSFFISG